MEGKKCSLGNGRLRVESLCFNNFVVLQYCHFKRNGSNIEHHQVEYGTFFSTKDRDHTFLSSCMCMVNRSDNHVQGRRDNVPHRPLRSSVAARGGTPLHITGDIGPTQKLDTSSHPVSSCLVSLYAQVIAEHYTSLRFCTVQFFFTPLLASPPDLTLVHLKTNSPRPRVAHRGDHLGTDILVFICVR